MPVIAVVGAVVASAIAAPAIGAVAAGAALSVSGALEITAAVGATMSAVGVVTGNKSLTTAGAVIGGVGAVGSLASAAGLIDGSTTLFGDGAANAGQTAVAASAGQSAANAVPGVAGADTGGNDVVAAMNPESGLTGFTGNASPATVGTANLPGISANPATAVNAAETPDATLTDTGSAAPTSSLINPAPAAAANATPPSSVISPQAATGAAPSPAAPVAAVPGAAAPTAPAIPSVVPVTPSQVTGEMSNPGASVYLNGILDFAKNNQLVTYGAIQAGGALISGMFNPLTPAQISAMDAQAANNRAAAALTTQQTQNIQSGQPTASQAQPSAAPISVTGRPAATVATPGMINTMPQSAAVTGIAA